MKALAILASLVLVGAAPATAPVLSHALTRDGVSPTVYPQVVRVDCGEFSGTAFRVGPQEMVSVNHVTSLPGCTIDGRPFTVNIHAGDFSIITTVDEGSRWLKIDCGGFVAGRKYQAIGYARGLDTITEVDLTATGRTIGGFSILSGVFTVVPGQSGGAVIDAQSGAVVGTVNNYNSESGLSGSIALGSTALCRS